MATLATDQRAVQRVARELASGKMPERVVEKLVADGWDPHQAREFVFGVRGMLPAQGDQIEVLNVNSRHAKHMIFGLVWLIVGAIVGAMAYTAGEAFGGKYVVAGCAMLFGIWQFFSGFTGLITNRD